MTGIYEQREDPLAQYRWKYCPFCGNEFVLDENRCSSCLAKRASSRWNVEQNDRKKPWRKILWERQPYDDNYVDHTFLIGLRKNVNVVEYDYWTVVRDSVAVSHQITVVALFLCAFMYTYYGTLSLRVLLPLNVVAFILGYLLRLYTDKYWQGINIIKSDIPRIVLTSAIVLTLSPIIHTLTQNISGDTVVALTVLMWLLHLALHDYAGYRPVPSPSPSSSTSLT
jgi:phosphatidylinositol glycan class C protein